jgi:pullulanase/glycogen debranching enzyme
LRDVAHDGEGVRFLRPDGHPLERADWHRYELRAFAIELATAPFPLYLAFNGGSEDRLFRLPEREGPGRWTWLLDTGHPEHGHLATPVVALYAHTLGLLGHLVPPQGGCDE